VHLQQATVFRERLLAHKCCKQLKRKQSLVKPFDRNLPENLLAMPDDKDLLVSINAQINILPD